MPEKWRLKVPLRFKFKVGNISFGKKTLNKTFKKKVEGTVRAGMREFLRTILEKELPPVLTGEARGSLKPLGRFLRVAVPISPTRKSRVAEGEAQGIKPVVKFRKTGITIRFGTRVEHYVFNDLIKTRGKFQKPRPWRSFELGTKSYNKFMRKNMKKRLGLKAKDFITVEFQKEI